MSPFVTHAGHLRTLWLCLPLAFPASGPLSSHYTQTLYAPGHPDSPAVASHSATAPFEAHSFSVFTLRQNSDAASLIPVGRAGGGGWRQRHHLVGNLVFRESLKCRLLRFSPTEVMYEAIASCLFVYMCPAALKKG